MIVTVLPIVVYACTLGMRVLFIKYEVSAWRKRWS